MKSAIDEAKGFPLMFSLALILALQAATPEPCQGMDVNLPPALSNWTSNDQGLREGHAVTLAGRDAAHVIGLPAKGRYGKAALINFSVHRAGRYGVALDQRGWIDVAPAANGASPLPSVAHGRGPACSTIRKVVRFDLQPGSYRLYITGMERDTARAMLVAPD